MEEYIVERRSKYDVALDIAVFLAVAVVTVFFILEIIPTRQPIIDVVELNKVYMWVNVVVLIIFVLDLYRLWTRSSSVSEFFKKNWLDILATIPFGLITYSLTPAGAAANYSASANSFFKLARLSKLERFSKVSRISKISKEFKAAAHLKKESEKYKQKHRI